MRVKLQREQIDTTFRVRAIFHEPDSTTGPWREEKEFSDSRELEKWCAEKMRSSSDHAFIDLYSTFERLTVMRKMPAGSRTA